MNTIEAEVVDRDSSPIDERKDVEKNAGIENQGKFYNLHHFNSKTSLQWKTDNTSHLESRSEISHDQDHDVPPLRGLSFLDRFLVIWIILSMAIGIILGEFVPDTGAELQKGQFVGVSIPIGNISNSSVQEANLTRNSCWSLGNDVSHLMQDSI